MTVECAGDTEFGLDAHNPPLHNSSVLVVGAAGAEPPARVRFRWRPESPAPTRRSVRDHAEFAQ
jgi:hypothetical protein